MSADMVSLCYQLVYTLLGMYGKKQSHVNG